MRLDRIREQEECWTLVTPLDHQGLLETQPEAESVSPDTVDDDALLAALGVEASAPDITELRHVRSSAEKRAAEEVATRQKCEDFETFQPLFEQIQRELDAGIRETRPSESRPTSSLDGSSSSGDRKPTWPKWARSLRRTTATRTRDCA